MPITLDATVLLVFGISQLAAYMGGGVVAWVITWEARRDRRELREERRRSSLTLAHEHKALAVDVRAGTQQICCGACVPNALS